jgi:hypothetical protein
MNYYINYFEELIRSGSIFWFCALSGSGMFLIQLILNIYGIGNQETFETAEISSNTIADRGQNSADVKMFKWLSMQTITGFLMMFGWSAITCQNEFKTESSVTIGISLISGLFTALIIRFIFKLAGKLKSSGTVYKIEDAVGKEGYLYQSISKGGKGKVSLSIENLTYEIDAISENYQDLPSFIRVKIIKKSDHNTVVVAQI